MRIRTALSSDAAQISQIYVDSWKSTYRGLLDDGYLDAMDCETARAGWEEYLRLPGRFAFVACAEDGPVVGFAAGMEDSPVRPGSGLLDSLHIAPACRGRGVGKSLMAEFAAELRRRNVSGMAITVIEGNDSARAIYEHLGAKTVGRRNGVYGDRVTEIVLYWEDVSVLCVL